MWKFTVYICQWMLITFGITVSGQQDLQHLEVAACGFPEEIQGAYRTQEIGHDHEQSDIQQGSLISEFYELRDPIRYRDIYVGPSAIPLWGDCFEKNGQTYILKLRKVGGFTCYRCFIIIQRTPNVLQVLNAAENICYVSASEAKQRCIDVNTVKPHDGMILYKSEHIEYQHCPVGGRAVLSYSSSGGRLHCPYPSGDPSTISNCKFGYQLDVSLRGCTFPAYDISFRCLGTWESGRGNGETFFALYNAVADEYRCGIFTEVKEGEVSAVAALSNDSSCNSVLSNSTNGYEQFVFFRNHETSNENTNIQRSTAPLCSFPDGIRGQWETMKVDLNSITFYHDNDPSTMSAIDGSCGDTKGDKFSIISKTQCGDTFGTTCLWWKPRSSTLFEVKLVHLPSTSTVNNACFVESIYKNVSWSIVSARTPASGVNVVTCPFFGQFGTVTQYQRNGRYCYNISTNCNQPNQFHLIKYLCSTDDVYEDSNYECMATWMDDDSTRFTFVNRTNDGLKGCLTSQSDISGVMYLHRATKQCQRKLDLSRLVGLEIFGSAVMVLQETSHCTLAASGVFPSPFDQNGQSNGEKTNWSRGNHSYKNGGVNRFTLIPLNLIIFLIVSTVFSMNWRL